MPNPITFTNPFTQSKGVGIQDNPKIKDPWRLKNPSIKIEDFAPELLTYLRSLPIDLQTGIVITAGKEEGHSVTGGHGKGHAVDISMRDEAWSNQFMGYLKSTSEQRKAMGLAFLDPEHGLNSGKSTAKHIHLSVGIPNEIAQDYFYGGPTTAPSEALTNTPTDNPPLIPPTTPEVVDNSEMIAQFMALIEGAKKNEEEEKTNVALTNAKNTLMQKQKDIQNKLAFVKDFGLQYETVDYSNTQQ